MKKMNHIGIFEFASLMFLIFSNSIMFNALADCKPGEKKKVACNIKNGNGEITEVCGPFGKNWITPPLQKCNITKCNKDSEKVGDSCEKRSDLKKKCEEHIAIEFRKEYKRAPDKGEVDDALSTCIGNYTYFMSGLRIGGRGILDFPPYSFESRHNDECERNLKALYKELFKEEVSSDPYYKKFKPKYIPKCMDMPRFDKAYFRNQFKLDFNVKFRRGECIDIVDEAYKEVACRFVNFEGTYTSYLKYNGDQILKNYVEKCEKETSFTKVKFVSQLKLICNETRESLLKKECEEIIFREYKTHMKKEPTKSELSNYLLKCEKDADLKSTRNEMGELFRSNARKSKCTEIINSSYLEVLNRKPVQSEIDKYLSDCMTNNNFRDIHVLRPLNSEKKKSECTEIITQSYKEVYKREPVQSNIDEYLSTCINFNSTKDQIVKYFLRQKKESECTEIIAQSLKEANNRNATESEIKRYILICVAENPKEIKELIEYIKKDKK